MIMLEAQSGELPPLPEAEIECSSAAAKRETIMSKVPIHFMGFLANVGNDAVTELQLGDGFVIERGSPSDVMPFLRRIDFHWGMRGRDDISPEGSYRVVKLNIAEFEATGRAALPFAQKSARQHTPSSRTSCVF